MHEHRIDQVIGGQRVLAHRVGARTRRGACGGGDSAGRTSGELALEQAGPKAAAGQQKGAAILRPAQAAHATSRRSVETLRSASHYAGIG